MTRWTRRPAGLPIAAVFVLATPAMAAAPGRSEPVGATYLVTIELTSSTSTDDGSSSGNSRDRDELVERVIAVNDGSLVLEYDLPATASRQDRARAWQFPARILRPADGPAQLLNASALQVRVDAWLKRGKVPRAACGHWIFTWTAVRIECEPQSVLTGLAALDWRDIDLRDGASFRSAAAVAPAPLSASPDGRSFTATLALDPATVRRQRAEQDLVLAEIGRETLSRAEAEQRHAADQIAGTITVRFEAAPDGTIVRRTTTTVVTSTEKDVATTQNTMAVVERRPIRTARPDPRAAGSAPGASTRPR